MSFMWMYGLARDIERLAGKEVYTKYGQDIIDCLKRICRDDDGELISPSDEEIIDVANAIVNYYKEEN